MTTCSGRLCSRVFVCYVGGLGFIDREFNFPISLRLDFYRTVTLCILQNLQESRADLC